MRIVIDVDEEAPFPGKTPDLYFMVGVTKMGHKAYIIHEAKGIPTRPEMRQILAAVLYGY